MRQKQVNFRAKNFQKQRNLMLRRIQQIRLEFSVRVKAKSRKKESSKEKLALMKKGKSV